MLFLHIIFRRIGHRYLLDHQRDRHHVRRHPYFRSVRHAITCDRHSDDEDEPDWQMVINRVNYQDDVNNLIRKFCPFYVIRLNLYFVIFVFAKTFIFGAFSYSPTPGFHNGLF